MQTPHHNGVFGGHAITKRLCSVGRRNARRVEQILATPRNAVQRSAIIAGGDFLIGLPGLLDRQFARQCDHAMQLRIKLLEPLEINVGQPLRSKLARLNPARELGHWSKRNIFISRGQRARIALAADEPVVFRSTLLPRQHGIP